jgi:hypothetical protein
MDDPSHAHDAAGRGCAGNLGSEFRRIPDAKWHRLVEGRFSLWTITTVRAWDEFSVFNVVAQRGILSWIVHEGDEVTMHPSAPSALPGAI